MKKKKSIIFLVEEELKKQLLHIAKERETDIFTLTAEYLQEYAVKELKKLKAQEITEKVKNFEENKKNEKNF